MICSLFKKNELSSYLLKRMETGISYCASILNYAVNTGQFNHALQLYQSRNFPLTKMSRILTPKQQASFIKVFDSLIKAQNTLNDRNIKVTQARLADILKVNRATISKQLKKYEISIINNSLFTPFNPLHKVRGNTNGRHMRPPSRPPMVKSVATCSNSDDIFSNLSSLETALLSTLESERYFPQNLGMKMRISFVSSIMSITRIVSQSERVHSGNKDYRYLVKFDKKYNFTKLFERYGNYIVGIQSSKTKFSDYFMNVIMPKTIEIYLDMKHKEVTPLKQDLLIPFETMKTLNARDTFILMADVQGVYKNNLVIEYKENDLQFSRKYNQFTAIKSDTRLKLGYTSYDLSAGLQSIVFNFLDVDKYPMHKILINDKKRIRNHIAKVLNKDIKEVKKMLTAGDNGKGYQKSRKECKVLDMYLNESKSIAKDFNQYISALNPTYYRRASQMAKNEYKTEWIENKKVVTMLDRKNKYSLFFFIWTQIEREARNAMVSCFKDKHDVREVHDAVYSKEVVSVQDMEEAILNQTGLNLSIEIE